MKNEKKVIHYEKTFPQGFEKTVKEFITTDTIQGNISSTSVINIFRDHTMLL